MRQDVATILRCVHNTLGGRGQLHPHKQAIMRSVRNSPITKELLPPETRRVCVETETREMIVSSLLQSMSELKTSKTKLGTLSYKTCYSDNRCYEWNASLYLSDNSSARRSSPECCNGSIEASDDGE